MVGEGWLIVSLVVGAVIFALHLASKKQNIATKMTLVLSVFLIISVGYVVIKNGVNFASLDGVFLTVRLYLSWLSQFFSNVTTITGNAVKLDWATNFSNVSSNIST